MEINIGIEIKYIEILLELDAFDRFLYSLEKSLKYLTDQEALRVDNNIRRLKDLTDIQIRRYNHTNLIHNILPRFFRNPALVSLYAIYESGVTGIASHLQQRSRKNLKLKDIRGGGFLDQANKYFKYVLEVPLYSDNFTWKHLKMLMVLRHTIAHCNGRLEAVNEKHREKIKKWEKQNIGINIHHGDLIISENFLRETYLIVKESLCDLIKRVN